jgi:aspartate racemase
MEKISRPYKTIGILGGMGPAASAELYSLIIDRAQNKYGAVQDTDYPPMIIYNLPLEGFDETGFVDKERVKVQLISGVQRLEKAGADFIVIACNTVHYYLDEMQAAIAIPILSLPEKTAQAVCDGGHNSVGLLASQSTREMGLYQKEFDRKNIETILATDEEQEILNTIILHVMAGKHTRKDSHMMTQIIERMVEGGAQAIVLGCTELPLVPYEHSVSQPIYNTLSVASESALEFAYRSGGCSQ